MYREGDEVVIIDNSAPKIGVYHSFPIGEVVTVHNIHKDGLWLDLHNPAYFQSVMVSHVKPAGGIDRNSEAKFLLEEDY